MLVKAKIAESTSRQIEPPAWTEDIFLLPTTIAQQGFWFLDRIDPGNPAYNIAVRFRLLGRLNREAFESAVQRIVDRHEILRTRISDSAEEVIQMISPKLKLDVGYRDLSKMTPSGRLELSDALAVSEARQRFDLTVGPLVRVNLLQIDELEHVLLITIHHIIADGWSIGIISSELGSLYQSACDDREPSLAPLPLQFGDFAVWQEKWARCRDFDEHRRYWQEKLADLPRLEIPTDRPRPRLQTSNGDIQSMLLPRELTDRLNSIAQEQGATLFILSLAALKLMLKRETKSNDIYVGTLIAGRSRVEIEPLIGPFINPLVLRTWISEESQFLDLLSQVSMTVLDAFKHGELPFKRLVEAIQPKRDMSRHPVFQINFIFQRDFVEPWDAAGLSLRAMPSKSPGAIYDLNFFMVEREDGWRASCEYNTDLYKASTIIRLLEHLRSILEAVADNPSIPLAELPGSLHRNALESLVAQPSLTLESSIHKPMIPPVESRLSEIWRQTLGMNVELNDDFFDVGGHSLLALKLLGQIERSFGQRLSLATFLHEPTIRSVAARLSEERSRSQKDQVIALQTQGTKVPLVLVDTGPYYRPLIRRLGPNQPVFGLALPELQDLPTQFTVGDIATNLIEALRAVQPHGPYYLSGWCHAGIIAFEMAHQLIAEGERIEVLMLFDADSPSYVRKFRSWKAMPIRLYFIGQKLVYHFHRARKTSTREVVRYASDRLKTLGHELRQKLWRVFYRNFNRYPYEHLKNASWFQFLAVADYHPQPLNAPIVLFRSKDLQVGRFRDPQLGWGQVAGGGLTVHEMLGNHSAMFIEPGVEALAERLAGIIPLMGGENGERTLLANDEKVGDGGFDLGKPLAELQGKSPLFPRVSGID